MTNWLLMIRQHAWNHENRGYSSSSSTFVSFRQSSTPFLLVILIVRQRKNAWSNCNSEYIDNAHIDFSWEYYTIWLSFLIFSQCGKLVPPAASWVFQRRNCSAWLAGLAVSGLRSLISGLADARMPLSFEISHSQVKCASSFLHR